MSKYDALWAAIRQDGRSKFTLSFAEIERAAGIPIDHSFLNYKKELLAYGYQVDKISLKKQTVEFSKTTGEYNAETVRAMREARDIASGKRPAKKFDSVKAFVDDLEKEP